MFHYSLIVLFLGISSVSSQQAQDDDGPIPGYSPVLVRQDGYCNYETSSSYAAAIAAASALEIEEKTEEKVVVVKATDVETTE